MNQAAPLPHLRHPCMPPRKRSSLGSSCESDTGHIVSGCRACRLSHQRAPAPVPIRYRSRHNRIGMVAHSCMHALRGFYIASYVSREFLFARVRTGLFLNTGTVEWNDLNESAMN